MFGLKIRTSFTALPPNVVNDDTVVPISTHILHLQDQFRENAATALNSMQVKFPICNAEFFDLAQSFNGQIRFGLMYDLPLMERMVITDELLYESAPAFTALTWKPRFRLLKKEIPHVYRGIAWVDGEYLPLPVIELKPKYVKYRTYFVEDLDRVRNQDQFLREMSNYETLCELFARLKVQEKSLLADMVIEGPVAACQLGKIMIPEHLADWYADLTGEELD